MSLATTRRYSSQPYTGQHIHRSLEGENWRLRPATSGTKYMETFWANIARSGRRSDRRVSPRAAEAVLRTWQLNHDAFGTARCTCRHRGFDSHCCVRRGNASSIILDTHGLPPTCPRSTILCVLCCGSDSQTKKPAPVKARRRLDIIRALTWAMCCPCACSSKIVEWAGDDRL